MDQRLSAEPGHALGARPARVNDQAEPPGIGKDGRGVY